MQLNEYPQAIADLQRQLLELDQRLTAQREQVAFCLNAIDRTIAFNQELKNDTQRKAKRTELMESDKDYIQSTIELKQLEEIRGQIDIDLKLLSNTFAILKLERREMIARMELNATLAA
jgi:hypothetical protein